MRACLVVVGVVIGLGLAGPITQVASALLDPGWWAGHSTEERHAIVDYVYERSGHATVPYEGDAATSAEEISQRAIDSGTHEFPLAGELGGEELTATEGLGLMPELAATVPFIGTAVGGTFLVRYAVGTGVHKLFAELQAPDDTATGGTWAWNDLVWEPYGTEILEGAKVQQSPGAYVFNGGYNGTTFPIARWFDPPCDFSGFTPPAGARMQLHVPTTGTCREFDLLTLEYVFYQVFVDYPYVLESDFKPLLPVRPFNAETDVPDATVATPPDPGVEAVEGALEMLDGEGFELLREQTDAGLTPGSQEDEEPVKVGAPVRREDQECRAYFGERPALDPGARAPEAERGAADWDYDVESFENIYNPLTRSTQTVKLRWGTKDWGYRHIVIRHGWEAALAERTRLALLTDRRPEPESRDRSGESFDYYYNIPSLPEGRQCRQLVVVSYRTDGRVPVGRHVITSFLEAY